MTVFFFQNYILIKFKTFPNTDKLDFMKQCEFGVNIFIEGKGVTENGGEGSSHPSN